MPTLLGKEIQKAININGNTIFKVKSNEKEHFSHQKEREEISTVLGSAWRVHQVERFWQEEELKEERELVFLQIQDLRNNETKVFNI